MLITQDDGIHIFKAAGYEVKISEDKKTFSLWEGENRLRGYSNITWLSNLTFILSEIKSISNHRGRLVGRWNLQKEMKELLGIKPTETNLPNQ